MRLLHFRRTFVEKLFAIHSKVNYSSATAGRSAATHVTTTTSSSWPPSRRQATVSGHADRGYRISGKAPPQARRIRYGPDDPAVDAKVS